MAQPSQMGGSLFPSGHKADQKADQKKNESIQTDKQKRLAKALRENLMRRKASSRSGVKEPGPEAPRSEELRIEELRSQGDDPSA